MEAGHACTGAEVDAVVVVQGRAGGAHALAQRLAERHGEGFEHGDLGADGVGRGRHFGTDEAGAHHNDTAAGGGDPFEVGADGKAVVERAQDVNAVERRHARKAAGRRTGGDHQTVEGDALSVVDHDLLAGEVESSGSAPQVEVEAEFVEPVGRAEEHLLGLDLARQ